MMMSATLFRYIAAVALLLLVARFYTPTAAEITYIEVKFPLKVSSNAATRDQESGTYH